jgi:hypothetical protein
MIREAFAAKVLLLQLQTLDHGTHGAIQDENALFQGVA